MTKKLLCIAAGVAALDQGVKALIRSAPVGGTLWTIPYLAEITHSVNTGAAFSLLSGHPALLAALSCALLGALAYFLCRMRLTRAAQAAFGVLIGGGAGNLIDRIAFSGVTDYIRLLLFDFPIFNLADIAITLSVGTLMALLLTGHFEQPTGEHDGSDHHAAR